MKIKITNDDIEAASSGGGGEPAPEGWYTAEIAKVAHEEPKDKNERWHVQYKIVQEEKDYSWLHEYIVMSESSKWKLTQYLLAVEAVKGAADVDLLKVMPASLGKLVRLRVVNESYTPPATAQNPEPQTRITAKPGGVFPYKGGASKASTNGDPLDKYRNMTEEELEAAEDEIRGIAGGYSVDPDDYSTWAEVIEAMDASSSNGEGADTQASDASDDGGSDTVADERWLEILGMGEEELADIADELDEYGAPLGLTSTDYEDSSWEEYREAINDKMNEGDGGDDSGDSQTEGEDYTTWSIPDLKKECVARDIDPPAKKADLVAALEADDKKSGPFGDRS
jgi:hypothetical protein